MFETRKGRGPGLKRSLNSEAPALPAESDSIKRKELPMEAYCVKCKAKREMRGAEKKVMKNGRPMMQGTCPVCGTKLTRILGSKEAAELD